MAARRQGGSASPSVRKGRQHDPGLPLTKVASICLCPGSIVAPKDMVSPSQAKLCPHHRSPKDMEAKGPHSRNEIPRKPSVEKWKTLLRLRRSSSPHKEKKDGIDFAK